MRRAFVDDDSLKIAVALAAREEPRADGVLGSLLLPERVAFRFARVLRLERGADVEVFDGHGHVGRGHFVPPATVKFTSLGVADDGLPPLVVVQALTKTDKLELVAQKATELGATRLVLWKAARAQVKLDDERGDKKVARLQRVADDAARQCGRSRPPVIEGPLRTAEVTALIKGLVDGGGVAVVGVVDAESKLSVQLHNDRVRLQHGFAIVVGPEGGVDGVEEDAFVDAGAVGVCFSRFVLRTETAALAALSLAQAALGEA